MQQRAVARRGFQGVPDRMPVVEQHALARLAFVAFDDVGLQFDRARHDRRQRLARPRLEPIDLRFQAIRTGRRRESSPSWPLRPSRSRTRGRQRRQQTRIGDDAQRLIERADQVLAARVIDAGLAADGRVHLRQQRRRRVDQADTAQVATPRRIRPGRTPRRRRRRAPRRVAGAFESTSQSQTALTCATVLFASSPEMASSGASGRCARSRAPCSSRAFSSATTNSVPAKPDCASAAGSSARASGPASSGTWRPPARSQRVAIVIGRSAPDGAAAARPGTVASARRPARSATDRRRRWSRARPSTPPCARSISSITVLSGSGSRAVVEADPTDCCAGDRPPSRAVLAGGRPGCRRAARRDWSRSRTRRRRC